MGDYVVALTILGAVGVMLLALPRALRPYPALGRHARAITHVLSGALSSLAVVLVDNRAALVVAGLAALPFLTMCIERGWFSSMLRGSRIRDYGFVAYAVAFALANAVFSSDAAIVAGIMTLAIADPAASLVGGRYGRHTVRSWQSMRTIEGAIGFATAAFAVVCIVRATADPSSAAAITGAALFTAITAAAVELIIPSAFDNFVIPLWTSLLYTLAIGDPARVSTWPLAAMIAACAAFVVYRLGWLNRSGSIGALLVAASGLGLGGWRWLMPMVVFLATSSVLTRLRSSDAHHDRTLEQTAINGIVPMLPVVGYAVTGHAAWYLLLIGAIAVANADTWATEVGRIFGHAPTSLRTLRPAPKGESGAITWQGTVASIAGGGLIGLTAAAMSPAQQAAPLLLAGFVIGPVGMLADSALGAWLQGRYMCTGCARSQERAGRCQECDRPCDHSAGVAVLTNERVNLAANLCGALLAAALAGMVAG